MRHLPRSLLVLTILSMSAGVARASSQAEDDPGMADGYRLLQESEARYRFEHQVRRQEGKTSILDAAAENDAVTGLLGQGIEAAASKVFGSVFGKILGNLPVDDIAKVLGRMDGGDTEGAAQAYATGWVGFLSGTIASLLVKSAVAGTAVATSMPAVATVGAVGVGIGVAFLAKKGFEYLLDLGKTEAPPRPLRPKIPKGARPSSVQLTDEQLAALKSTMNALDNPASQPAPVPPASFTISVADPVLPVVTQYKPSVPDTVVVPPTKPTDNPATVTGPAATVKPVPPNAVTVTSTNVSKPSAAQVPPPTAPVPPQQTTKTPAAPTKAKPPRRTVPANQTCPSCGVRTTTYNTPLCNSCTARVNLDRTMQRAAEAKGQKRKPRESQYWQYLPN